MKNVTINNGVGTIDIINGNYTVTADVVGYNNTTINPNSVSINAQTNSYAFTITADGTLTLHVTEEGTVNGTPVVGATFIRTDSLGTEYGNVITTDSLGNAVFNNVPYADNNAPIIYYKQLASDGNHEFDGTVKNVTLTTNTETIEVQNAKGAERTITLTDENYSGLPIETGTITFNN